MVLEYAKVLELSVKTKLQQFVNILITEGIDGNEGHLLLPAAVEGQSGLLLGAQVEVTTGEEPKDYTLSNWSI